MGSGHSSPAQGNQPLNDPPSAAASKNHTEIGSGPAPESPPPAPEGKRKKPPPKNESGYARAQRICRKKKRAYDSCYTTALSSKEEDCADVFEAYRTCFLRVMTKDMEERGVKVSENSMIGEYKEDISDEEDGR